MSYSYSTGPMTVASFEDDTTAAIEGATGDRDTARNHRPILHDIVRTFIADNGWENFTVSVTGHHIASDEHTHEGWSSISVTVHDVEAPAEPEVTPAG